MLFLTWSIVVWWWWWWCVNVLCPDSGLYRLGLCLDVRAMTAPLGWNMASIARLYMSRISNIGRKAVKCRNPDYPGGSKEEGSLNYIGPIYRRTVPHRVYSTYRKRELHSMMYSGSLTLVACNSFPFLHKICPSSPVAPLSEQRLLIRYAGRKTVWRMTPAVRYATNGTEGGFSLGTRVPQIDWLGYASF